ncbi:MAG: hypothetical protein ACOCU6_03300 [Nanoarchaeota archaeon]
MNARELKHEIRNLLGEVSFNKEFDKHTRQLQGQSMNLIKWCYQLREGMVLARPSRNNRDVILFIKKIGSSNRCIVIKKRNGVFTECYLGDHKYYDYPRKQLGL